MEVSYDNLHLIFHDSETIKGQYFHVAKISHTGIAYIRSKKQLIFEKVFKDESQVALKIKIDEQFAKWDKKWKGSFPGPNCDYNANQPLSGTGFTWRELEEHRNKMRIEHLSRQKITNIETHMLLVGKVPTYNQFFDITLPKQEN